MINEYDQLLNKEDNKKYWIEQEKNKPNGVMFKMDDGQLVIVVIKDGKWDWDNCKVLDMSKMRDKYDDISPSNPFEFVFVKWVGESLTTMNQKTFIPNYSFSKLFDEGKLEEIIRKDYENQYGFYDT